MKRIAYYLFALVGMLALTTACSDDEEVGHVPQIYFDQHYYTLGKTSVDLILTADEAPTKDVTIPVYFGGEPQEGVDFELDENYFTFHAGDTVSRLTINRIVDNIGDDSEKLYVNLKEAPEGFNFGLSNFAEVNLLGNNGVLMSFTSTTGEVKTESEFQINLVDMKGSRYRPTVATTFDLEVDETSTAVEGEHFEFVDGAYATVNKNRYYGTFGIKFLKKEEGKDKLVLRFADKEGYATGANPTMTITMKGPDVFTGTWQFDSLMNKESLIDSWSEYYLPAEQFPVCSTSDRLIFEGSDRMQYTFTSQMTSDLKNYFGNSTRTATYVGDKELAFSEGSSHYITLSELEISDVNLNFSAEYNDNSRSAKVGFRLTTNDDGEEVLDCFIYDFIPKGDAYGNIIWTEYESYGMDPTDMMQDIALRLQFKRVK